MKNPISIETIQQSLIDIRDQQVLLDSNVARIYGVETKRINEAVRNNPDKFPDGYLLELSREEWSDLKSKFSSSSWGGKNKLPTAFTERGLYMLATVLKSRQATDATILIIDAFAKLREIKTTITKLANTRDERSQNSLMRRGGHLVTELLDDHLHTSDTETSLEVNFAVVKFKHAVKRKR